MSFLSAFVLKYLPFCTAFAAANSTMSKIVSWAAGIGGGVVALFLIISLAKDGIGLAKGSGDSSILKIIGKALFLILIIGLIYLAMNYDSLGNKAKNVANKGVDTVDTEVNKAL
jgi:hypothetical protein